MGISSFDLKHVLSPSRTICLAGFLLFLGLLVFLSHSVSMAQSETQPVPLLAYYYIWFDETSWDRAKTDYPLLGNYSSDDRQVMTQHILWAMQAGIDGFIVSWKHTETLDRRLMQLAEIAGEQDFKLLIIYQGLDFERDPLPADRIAADLQYFITNFSQMPVFDLFNRPVVIWSGTWKFSSDEIKSVHDSVGTELLLLGSERNLEGFLRIADWVDGNAYYWSSVNPNTFPGYQEKLIEMSNAIHERGGLWIAPAAPGFDAKLIGGTRVVERSNGITLLQEMQAAYNSSPDAIGLISWNEFSENTHIEPSQNYDSRYLEVLADYSGVTIPVFEFFDSEPLNMEGTDTTQPAYSFEQLPVIIILGALLILVVGINAIRRLK